MIEHHHGSYREPRKRVFPVRTRRTEKRPGDWKIENGQFVKVEAHHG